MCLQGVWERHSLPLSALCDNKHNIAQLYWEEGKILREKVAALMLHFYCIYVNEMPSSLLSSLHIVSIISLSCSLLRKCLYSLLAFSIKLLSSNDTLPH